MNILNFFGDKRVPPLMLWSLLKQGLQPKRENNKKTQSIYAVWTVDIENLVSENSKRIATETTKLAIDMAENDIHGTFFVQGEIVRQIGPTLREVVKNGHEIGLHGYTHDNWGDEQWFLKDNVLSGPEKEKFLHKAILDFRNEKLPKPISFRAPNLSINEETIRLLNSLGFKIDSSFKSFLGGGSTGVAKNRNSIDEIPVTSQDFGKVSFKKGFPYLNYQMLTIENIVKFTKSEMALYLQEIIREQSAAGLPIFLVILSHNWEFSTNSKFSYSNETNFDKVLEFINEVKKTAQKTEFVTIKQLDAKLWKK